MRFGVYSSKPVAGTLIVEVLVKIVLLGSIVGPYSTTSGHSSGLGVPTSTTTKYWTHSTSAKAAQVPRTLELYSRGIFPNMRHLS